MAEPVNRVEALAERNVKRLEKADKYTQNQSVIGRARAQTHTRLGNDADTAITAAGSKTVGIVTGGAWGLIKGAALGLVVATIGATLFPFMAMSFGAAFAMYMGGTMLISTLKGCRDGYYNAEMHYSAKTGKKVGDKIAAEGNAQAPKVKDKVVQEAAKQARDEMPKLEAAEMQNLNHTEKTDTHYRDMVTQSRQQPQQGQGHQH